MSPSRKVLLVGWDAADWSFINPLMDAGLMPALQSVVDRGTIANLATLRPTLSPILWTSIATGKRGHKHGVLSFLEQTPDGTDVQPATSTSRSTRALWNILTHAGKHVHNVAWYATHPAEPISGVCVSDQFLRVDESKLPDWPLPEHAVHPERWRPIVEELRLRPNELGASDLVPFIPELASIDADDPRPRKFARLLARAASVQSVATEILRTEPWDFCSVFFDAIDTAGHLFMPMHPPAMPDVSPRDAQLYSGVMSGVYRFHDMMLHTLLQLAGPDATIVLVSDHGFYNDHRRPRFAGESEDEQAAAWHAPLGIFAMAGPGIRQDERIYSASVLDVAPTILAAMDLPVGRDMDGRVLEDVFEQPPAVRFIPSHDDLPGDAGLHAAELRVDPTDAAESVRQLVELGYLAPVADDARARLDVVRRERLFNLALMRLDADQPDAAAESFEALAKELPTERRYRLAMASAFLAAGRRGEALAALDALDADGLLDAEAKVMRAQQLAMAGRGAEAGAVIVALAQSPQPPRTLQAIGLCLRTMRRDDDAKAALEVATNADPTLVEAWATLAAIALDRGDPRAAIELATRAVAQLHAFAPAHHLIGLAHERLGDLPAARASYERALSVAPNHADAKSRLAAVCTRLGDIEAAARAMR